MKEFKKSFQFTKKKLFIALVVSVLFFGSLPIAALFSYVFLPIVFLFLNMIPNANTVLPILAFLFYIIINYLVCYAFVCVLLSFLQKEKRKK